MLRDEPGAARIERVIEVDGALVSWINLGEVFYVEARARGAAAAASAVEALSRQVTAEEPDAGLILEAARVKAAHRLSYADAFAVATAERHRLPLLTGDPELLALEREATVVDPRG